MNYVVVPNSLRDAINAKLDEHIALCPESAAFREQFYAELLRFFDEHGYIPDFTILANMPKKLESAV